MSDANGPQLDADALDLLDAFRDREQIPDAVHDRVWDRVAADIVAGPAEAESASSAHWARRGAVLGLLAAAAVGVLWLGGRGLMPDDVRAPGNQAGYDQVTSSPGGLTTPRDARKSSQDTAGHSASHSPAAPLPSEPSEPTSEAQPETEGVSTLEVQPRPGRATAPSRESRPSKPRGSTAPRKTPAPSEPEPKPNDTLAEENRLLGRARAALIADEPGRALTLLREHAQRFADGVLTQERRALRAVALCEAGREDEGVAAARSFLRAHPQATLARRVRSACLE
ncbi:MAG: hypothetical protein AAGF11_19945 [Myxococcota bacterium]